MKNFRLTTIALGIFCTATMSCKDMIDIKPTEQLDAGIALNSKANIEAATNGVYATLRNVSLYGRDLVAYGDGLADNVLHTGVSTSLQNITNNTFGSHFNTWAAAFDGINRANLVLGALQTFEGDKEWKDNLEAQLFFLRALLYFDLAKVYAYDPKAVFARRENGTVPLQTKGVIAVSQLEIKPRASITDTYQFIYTDLDSAYTKLKRVNSQSTNPHKVTLSAVSALYSRVALHDLNLKKVLDYSNVAINGNVGSLTNANNYVAGWRSDTHPESIFEIKVNVRENLGANESLRATYTSRAFADSKEPSTHGLFSVSDELFSLYTTADVRKQLIIKGLGNNLLRNEMTKFISKGGVKDLDNIPVIRMPEMYLNKAEAYYRDSKIDSAQANLNVVLVNRGLAATTLTGSALFEEIIKQRRLEYAFEGYRWFDLKRLQRNVVKLPQTINASDTRILARVPISEINSSKNIIKQNDGY